MAEPFKKRALSIGIENLQLQVHLQGTYQVQIGPIRLVDYSVTSQQLRPGRVLEIVLG